MRRVTSPVVRKLLACAGLLFATILWGGGFVAVKDSLDSVPPIYMIALRFTLASVIMGVIFFKTILRMGRASFLRGLFLSALMFVSYAFQTIGCIYTTAGKNAFLTTIYVILAPLVTWFFTRKAPHPRVFAAAIIAIAGIGLLSLRGDLSVNIGDALTLVSGLWFALHIYFISHYTQNKKDDPIALTVLQMFGTAALAWIFAPFYDGALPLSAILTGKHIFWIVYLAVFSSSIAFLLQNICQKYLPPTTVALLLSTEALFGALASAIFLHERMNARMLAGCLLMLTAVVVSEAQFRKQKPGNTVS